MEDKASPTWLSVAMTTNMENGKVVICEVTDRGPAKKLVEKGRIVDLSKRSFEAISDLKKGVIQVRVEYYEQKK